MAAVWCLAGALIHSGSEEEDWNAIQEARHDVEMSIYNRHGCSVPDWNDDPARTKNEVVGLLLELAYEDEDLNEAFQSERAKEVA